MAAHSAKLIVVITLLLLASTLVEAQVQQGGCCCRPDPATPGAVVLSPPTPTVQSECPGTFYEWDPPDPTQTSNQDFITYCRPKCEAVQNLPPTQSQSCADPSQSPISQVSVEPVKGKKSMRVSWEHSCRAEAYKVSRCKGTSCTDFVELPVLLSGTNFLDEDPALEMDLFYRYAVTPLFSGGAAGTPVINGSNIGHLECLDRTTEDNFCLSFNYYVQYEQYLKSYGYRGEIAGQTQTFIPAGMFVANFSQEVNRAFNTKFNNAYSCTSRNELKNRRTCTSGTTCRPSTPPTCLQSVNCGGQGLLFGLGTSREECEGEAGEEKPCFYDRSPSIFSTCYPCSSALSCYDYKSNDSCSRNPCLVGQCEWHAYSSGGVPNGVCVDKEKNNCVFCNQPGSVTSPTRDVFSEVFDACTLDKVNALSTPKAQCFFSEASASALDCSQASCLSYDQASCGSPAGGIKADDDHEITTGSDDSCNFGVCQWNAGAGKCQKNADATNISETWPDCLPNDVSCEKDLFSPSTTIIQGYSQNKVTSLKFQIRDRKNASSPERLISGDALTSYRTFMCVQKQTGCNYQQITGNLTINDLDIRQQGQVKFTLSEGPNTLKYYTQDPAKNREIVRSLVVQGCYNCTGPQDIAVEVGGAHLHGGVYYVSSSVPNFTVTLDEPGRAVKDPAFPQIRKGSQVIDVTYTSGDRNGFISTHIFKSSQSLPDGNYTMHFNAEDAKGTRMAGSGLVITFVVDTSPPDASVSLSANQVLAVTPFNVRFNVTELLRTVNVSIEEEIPVNSIGAEWKTVDYSGRYDKLPNVLAYQDSGIVLADGFKQFQLIITDLAGNKRFITIPFFVNAKGPEIWVEKPQFGVASTQTFDFVIKTDSVMKDCRYWLGDTFGISFQSYSRFDSQSDRTWTKKNFNEITTPNAPHEVHVECVDDKDRRGATIIPLSFVQGPLRIKRVFPFPDPIVQLPSETIVSVELNQPSYCRYSLQDVPYESMTEFPGFGPSSMSRPETSVAIANVSVPRNVSSAKIYVGCKNALGTGPVYNSTMVRVDLGAGLVVTSTTPSMFTNLTVPLHVNTNKDAICRYIFNGTTNAFRNDSKRSHHAAVSVGQSGMHVFRVRCTTTQETTESVEQASFDVSVLVDNTPPVMLYVKDDSNANDTQISYFKDKLQVAWLGNETESQISQYLYKVKSFDNKTVLDCTRIPLPPGCKEARRPNPDKFFYLDQTENKTKLNLSERSTYFVFVAAQNILGANSSYNSSDGVVIDLSRLPRSCTNGILDTNESGIDCGGPCGPTCKANETCRADNDCASQVCDPVKLRCTGATCDDKKFNGDESDVDCGGPCALCSEGKSCYVGKDCTTGFCSVASRCAKETQCSNGRLDPGETDLDCGGVCPFACGLNKRCVKNSDCAGGSCRENTCRTCDPKDVECRGVITDSDEDGVPDNVDKCLRTPKGQSVDASGCAPSQKDTDKDGMFDDWEVRYGLDIETDDSYLDLDGDGLTNLEEYEQQTDPSQVDTDGDGWSDYDELIRGFDPNDPDNHPTSRGFLILFVVLILLIAGGVGYYMYYTKKTGRNPFEFRSRFAASSPIFNSLKGKMMSMKPGFRPIARPQPLSRPAPKQAVPQAREAQKSAIPDDWLTLDKIRKQSAPTDAFSKLKSLGTTPAAPKPAAPKNAFERLSSLSTKSKETGAASSDSIQKLRSTVKGAKPAEPSTGAKLAELAKKAKQKKP